MNAAPLKRRRRVVKEDGPDPIDVFVGKRMRERRLQVGLSQPALAERLGVAFQQVQKYEIARNRISASTLFRLCQALEVQSGYFFDGYFEPGSSEAVRRRKRPKRDAQPKSTGVTK